eukprot:g12379.t1
MKQHNSVYAVEEDGQDEQERQSNVPPNIKDLPVFLRKLVTHSAKVTYRRSMMLLYFLAQIHTFFVWYQITQSSVVGGILAFFQALAGASDIYFQPDFSQGFFLSLLLNDLSHTKKLEKEVKGGIIGNLVMTTIIMSVFTYFFAVPFANSKLLGDHTFIVTVTGTTIAHVAHTAVNILGVGLGAVILDTQLQWENKVKGYLKRVRRTLILEDEEVAQIEDGKNKTSWIVNKLSIEQRKIDQFARSFSNGIGTYNGQSMIVCVIWLFICAVIIITPSIGANARANVLISLGLLVSLLLWWAYVVLQGLSRPNRIWEETRRALLSDAKIQQAKIEMGWTCLFRLRFCSVLILVRAILLAHDILERKLKEMQKILWCKVHGKEHYQLG